ncbi:MAG: PrsW family glutamic-type intramembrane protease [Patescibacteria group bacterium]
MLLFVLILTFIAIAIGLAWYLIAHDRGQKEPIAALWMATGLGVAGGLMAALLESRLLSVDNLTLGTPQTTILVSALTIGIIEEACKFLPLAFVIYKRRYFNEHTDGVIYFALAGLGCGVPENILYTIQFGTKAGMIRVLLTPFFHAATTGVVGYFLIKRKLSGRSLLGVIAPLLGVMVLHGLYDFGLIAGGFVHTAMALLITLGMSVALFVVFLRASELDQDRGLSAVGHNSFCRSCGQANPDHNLYCVHCGKNA